MHAFDGYRKLRASGRWAGPVIKVWIPFDSLTTRAAAARAAHHRWVLLTGACDDEYSTCWLSVQQQTVVGSLPHDGG